MFLNVLINTKRNVPVYQDHISFRKEVSKKIKICRIKLDVKNIKFRLLQLPTAANISILISTKFKNQTLSKANDSFFKNLALPFSWKFSHALGIIAFDIKIFSTYFFIYMTLHRNKIKWYVYIPSCETFHQTIQRPDWLGLLKTWS